MKKTVKNARLREIRKKAGVTQQEIADYLNMSRGAYQHMETKGTIPGDILIKLARFFGVSEEEILGTEEEVHPILPVPAEPNAPNNPPPIFEQPKTTDVIHIVLSKDEQELLTLYRQLSPEEQLRLHGYIEGRFVKYNQQ